MNVETETVKTAWCIMGVRNSTAPSLRVPVTADNRALLRWLRTAELSAWEDADRRPHAKRNH